MFSDSAETNSERTGAYHCDKSVSPWSSDATGGVAPVTPGT